METDPDKIEENHSNEKMSIIEQKSKQKRPKVNVWPTVCQEIETELQEVDEVLSKIGISAQHNIHKKSRRFYPYNDYEAPPNPKTCFSKDFADYHIFPDLLPAIQSLIVFARKNRVFQCRYCTFNALDYLVEYLYNNNPRYPERSLIPTPLYEIPFAKEWLAKFPRKPYPKWLTMTDEEAALIIQRVIRGYLVRRREDVQEMRQFWRDYQKDVDDEKNRRFEKEPLPIYSPYYDQLSELSGESEGHHPPEDEYLITTHSDTCYVCNRFRDFLHRQEMYRLSRGQLSESSAGSVRDDSIEDTSTIQETTNQKSTKPE